MKFFVNTLAGFSILLSSFVLPINVFAEDLYKLPFNHSIDIKKVRALTRSKPEKLLSVIEAMGIDVQLYKSGKELNPMYSGLKYADQALIQVGEFEKSYEGRFLSKSNPEYQLKKDVIILKDNALPYTLIHEVMHSMLSSHPTIDFDFLVKFKTFQFRQRKTYNENFYNLLIPQWREDILSAQEAVIPLVYGSIQNIQSQEAIIEKILAKEISKSSPYYQELRRLKGLRFGEMRINNAIDVFNEVHGAIQSGKDAIIHLREGLDKKELTQDGPYNLNHIDTNVYVRRSDAMLSELLKVKDEILKLKKFYAEKI